LKSEEYLPLCRSSHSLASSVVLGRL
jgi:hypothetical protein